jgi:hypothetical protein
MADSKGSCPKCGSIDVVDWGTTTRMCRRCHEIFDVSISKSTTKEPSAEDASKRAEAFLEDLKAKRLVGGKVQEPSKVQRYEKAPAEKSETITVDTTDESADVSAESLIDDFSKLFGKSSEPEKPSYTYESREPSSARRQEYSEIHNPRLLQQPAKKKNKTVGCVIAAAVIGFWILMMVICSVMGK